MSSLRPSGPINAAPRKFPPERTREAASRAALLTPKRPRILFIFTAASPGPRLRSVLTGSDRITRGLSRILSTWKWIFSGLPLECSNARSAYKARVFDISFSEQMSSAPEICKGPASARMRTEKSPFVRKRLKRLKRLGLCEDRIFL